MRTTRMTITCDRCGLDKPVKDWSWSELRVLHERGWSSYSSGAINEYRGGKKSKLKDLCPPCTTGMQAYMNVEAPESWEDLFDVQSPTVLVSIRKTLNRTLRTKRKEIFDAA